MMNNETVTQADLYEAFRGRPYEPKDAGYVRVHVSLLRQALKGFPLRIDTYSGYGYALRRT